MNFNLPEWVPKILSIPKVIFFDVKSRIPKILVIAWVGSLLGIWISVSIKKTELVSIHWSLLLLIIILLGANVGVGFEQSNGGGGGGNISKGIGGNPDPNKNIDKDDPIRKNQENQNATIINEEDDVGEKEPEVG